MRTALRLFSVLILLATTGVLPAQSRQAQDTTPPALSAALSTVGAIGVADIYMAYMAVGLVADAHAYGNEGYDKESVSSIMAILASLTENSRKALQTLLDSGLLDQEDTEVTTQLIRAYEAIERQARQFITYLSTGEVGDYELYRRSAWAVIAKLYGFSE